MADRVFDLEKIYPKFLKKFDKKKSLTEFL